MDHDNSDSDSSNESEHPLELENEQKLEAEDKKRAQIRKRLSTMTFEEIQKLKEKIGAKVYDEVVFGIKTKKAKTDFKRVNKNRPREMSSKIRVRTDRPQSSVLPAKKKICRDPRFDAMCGEYDESAFRENYKFVNDIKKNEKKELEKELSKTVDKERKEQLKFLIQRLGNQIREAEKREIIKQKELEERSEIREKRKKGEKPMFKKKSEKKVGELISKYEELKKTNKLQKHIEKRQRKGL